ncbi:MAG: SRPBCC domain-containing protein [Rhodospirillaceae bacterium]|nr:SRPBCC domain-containing protein [Rhodospirillaceae bacterium]
MTADTPTLTVEREIEATAEELFDAWLDPESLAVWMRPGDIPRTDATVDARVGGTFKIVMHGSEKDYVHTGTYRRIDRPKKLVFTWVSEATYQRETLVTVVFQRTGKKTKVILTHEQLPDEAAANSHRGGWTSAIEKLAESKNG